MSKSLVELQKKNPLWMPNRAGIRDTALTASAPHLVFCIPTPM